jgi:hypothetical protein
LLRILKLGSIGYGLSVLRLEFTLLVAEFSWKCEMDPLHADGNEGRLDVT